MPYQQALPAWKLIYKHNFSPTTFYIWNNGNILYKKKLLYYIKWVDKGIILVKQLLNTDGNLLTYGDFISKFNSHVTPEEYIKLFHDKIDDTR